MSEKLQYNTERTREQMSHRYGNVYYHKHDKRHHTYRQHCRSHVYKRIEESQPVQVNYSTGLIRKLKLQKLKKHMMRKQVH